MASTGNLISAGGSFIGGLGSLIGGLQTSAADQAEAAAFDTAARYAEENALLSGEVGGLQEYATARQIQHVQGTQIANAAANGLKVSGSALSLIRDSTTQGALAEGQIGLQTSINVVNFEEQSKALIAQGQAAQAAAQAAQTGGIFGALGGVIGGIAKLFF